MAASRLVDLIKSNAKALPPLSSDSFGSRFDHLGKYTVVLLGDGTHGTSEFYQARAEITKHLIQNHGFDAVTVEADWPDSEAVDRYVRQRSGVKAKIERPEEPAFQRFPTWMWQNSDVQDMVHWMRDYNRSRPSASRVGFYGLDLYSMGRSIDAVIKYLDAIDPNMAKLARQRYGCLQPWVEDPTEYGLASYLDSGMKTCEEAVLDMLRDLLQKRLEYTAAHQGGDEFHSAEQNAYLVADAEAYYRAMYSGSVDSWSLRDSHMFETLKRILNVKGPESKVVVWAHNSHIGDARYTSMGRRRGELNIGQLCREEFGRDNVALIGCGTHTGTVAAAHEWGGDVDIMDVVPSRSDSWEYLAHQSEKQVFYLELRKNIANAELLHAMKIASPRLERFIGVIYRPRTERTSHYSSTDLADQFDGFIWFERTEAVKSLVTHQPHDHIGADETYPFGL
ncbi:TPA_exp: Uncharacterized protein A8136_4424 [Trichophyton benhamiae CBS 112371]|uniref:Erythromycin esterase n=1 Tax=Arthroderma benhamiae (strain ATCC MYA-4681 / CBS 112371) TaxID=663331 RepID=D4AN55_ARTBC|nr:uncharacterized protein ARB_05659 [Trichophyton benhamiae CBS 112371]EFE35616.1 hypothetical protein ARB_05659 [Trichophyton benhamiae CBS 112371]DAA78448.1 TPA_exp: Uncharacterized protein A8136_4424 [Trichophyton benhamiae CBS 112371]